ncbi:hypothetical protein LMG26858_03412 [Achromobacter anxifer]|jgi:microcystin degradation protein MlrC|uniref:Microcystinase C n=1 Tax=Achromobacter anxifer TaxID=1287737 RepID=A0A6S7DA64_9BURK|nr:M81 family metallopeptidase [Achromobacter anxifer]CAB3884650.1 hypothetical protein LMG26858_03412 [Achromobacter anxifer]
MNDAGRKKRLAVARFWYEGNAFCPAPCVMADFERREWRKGEDALVAAAGTATELGEVAEFAHAHPDWEVVALRCASALPGGPIEDAVHRAFTEEVLAGLGADRWDAVYLSLHGAAITDRRQTPDLDFVRAVRALLPGVPLGASFDLHANLAPALGGLLDCASGYKTYPHIDMRDAARRVLDMLVRMQAGELSPRVLVAKPDLLLSSFNMRTDAGPMRELQDLAVAQAGEGVVEVSVFGGFPYADTADTGASVLVVSDSARDPAGARAHAAAESMMAAMRRLAPAFAVTLPTPQEGLAQAVALARAGGGLVAVTDPGDNPLSGGVCDTPALFRALLDARIDLPCVFASFADPDAVWRAHEAGQGGHCELDLGGRVSRDFGLPVRAAFRVERYTDGEFSNTGPMETGVRTSCGRTALLSLRDRPNVQVIVTELVAPANDPGFFTLHGIDLDQVRLLCVKAKNHFRAAFLPLCAAIIDVDAPGPAALDLRLLPFRHARRGAGTNPGTSPDASPIGS